MKILTVVPLQKSTFTSELTYFSAQPVEVGNIVEVSVRKKKILALVISSNDVSELKSGIKDMTYKLKKINQVKEKSIFKKEFLDSCFLFSSYFATTPNNAVAQLIPALFKDKYDDLAKFCKDTEKQIKVETGIKKEKLLFQAPLEDRLSYYKTLIRGYFAHKKSAFIVLPTEHDIHIFNNALSKGIEKFTFIMHSGMKQKELIEHFGKIMNSTHSILVLATPAFLSMPIEDLGSIIIEHESSRAYRMVKKPHFDMRVFAEIYAAKVGAKFILADTLLRFETIGRKDLDSLNEVYPISYRIKLNEINMKILNPNENNEDMVFLPTEKEKRREFKLFGEDTIERIEKNIGNKKKVMVFSLRKGLATYTVCHDCSTVLTCTDCLAPVVLYESSSGKRMFICNKCRNEKDPDTICKNCASWNLTPLGIGTDTVYEELKRIFPKTKVLKLDKESAKTATSVKKIMQEFEKPGKPSILVGTEMMFFNLKQKADLSIVSSFDSLWSIPNYKISERILQLLLSVLANTKKEIIIQTKNKNDPALLYLQSENLLPFVREELKDREKLGYPPYKRFIKITREGTKEEAGEARIKLKEIFEGYDIDIFSGFVARNKNKYATNALIKLSPIKWSLPELSIGGTIDKKLGVLLSYLPPDYEVNVDPEDLL